MWLIGYSFFLLYSVFHLLMTNYYILKRFVINSEVAQRWVLLDGKQILLGDQILSHCTVNKASFLLHSVQT